MKRFFLLALTAGLLSGCSGTQDSKINIVCEIYHPEEKDGYTEKFFIDTEDNLAIVETTLPADDKYEESTERRLGTLTITPRKYIVQYEHENGGYQLRETYSFNKNDVSKVKPIYEIKEDSINYVIDKYATYEAYCVKGN